MRRPLLTIALLLTCLVGGCASPPPAVAPARATPGRVFADYAEGNVSFRTVNQSSGLFRSFISGGHLGYAGGARVSPASVALRSTSELHQFLADYPLARDYIGADGVRYGEPFPPIDFASETGIVLTFGSGDPMHSVRVDSVIAYGSGPGQITQVFATDVTSCLTVRSGANPATILALRGKGRNVWFSRRGTDRINCD